MGDSELGVERVGSDDAGTVFACGFERKAAAELGVKRFDTDHLFGPKRPEP